MVPGPDDEVRYVGSSERVAPTWEPAAREDEPVVRAAEQRPCAVCDAVPAPRTRASVPAPPGAAVVARSGLDLCRTCDRLVEASDASGLTARMTGRSAAEGEALLRALLR